ncbi:hypothetical protein, partial [Aeromonas caviae]|uniref:hypothetical protein n=2 Tax=Aeromonas caviae TaxID=648 RepID=UPI002B4976D3
HALRRSLRNDFRKGDAEPARLAAFSVVIANSGLGSRLRRYSHPNPTNGLLSFSLSTKQALTRQGVSGLCSNYFESRQSV